MRLSSISLWSVLSLVALTAPAAIASGCSGEDPSVFTPPAPDAAPPPDTTVEAGTFFPEDGGVIFDSSTADVTAICTPAAIPGFKATWKPPTMTPMACTDAQITAYFTACLEKTSTATSCTTFLQLSGNKTCGQCLDSEESASTYGPFIWHSNRTNFTLNVAGCIANELKDVTDMGCGAAYQASIACKQASCVACESSGDFNALSTCKQKAGGVICKTYGDTFSTKCVGITDAGAPTIACFPATGENNTVFFTRVAKLFCGAP